MKTADIEKVRVKLQTVEQMDYLISKRNSLRLKAVSNGCEYVLPVSSDRLGALLAELKNTAVAELKELGVVIE